MFDYQFDYHIHSKYSDGSAEVDEIARKAKERGMKAIAIVDHSIEFHFGLTESKAKQRLMDIENAQSTYGIKIYSGIECTIDATGNILLPDFDFDFVIVSVHEYISGENYYRRVFSCIENCEFDVIGHPFSRLFAFDSNIRELDEKLLSMIEEREIAIEVNSSHFTPPESFLELCKDRKLIYSIGSDAHDLSKLGDVGWSVKMVKSYFNRSKPFVP